MNDGLEYGPRAVAHPHRPRRWLAQFSGERFGVRFVKGRDGAPIVFDCPRRAREAATDALLRALNENMRPVQGRTFVVRMHGTRAHAALVEEVFGAAPSGKARPSVA